MGHHQFKGRRVFKWKAILKRYVLRFLRKEARLTQDVNVIGSSFEMMGAATFVHVAVHLSLLFHVSY